MNENNKKLYRYFQILLLICLQLPACLNEAIDIHSSQEYASVPPYELIQSNYEQASQVVAINIDSREIEKRVYADDGALGYIVSRETGIVLRVYKGSLKPGQAITYHDWLEFQPGWKSALPDTNLVFLTQHPKTRIYHTIGEASVFPLTERLEEIITEIVEQKKQTTDQKQY